MEELDPISLPGLMVLELLLPITIGKTIAQE